MILPISGAPRHREGGGIVLIGSRFIRAKKINEQFVRISNSGKHVLETLRASQALK